MTPSVDFVVDKIVSVIVSHSAVSFGPFDGIPMVFRAPPTDDSMCVENFPSFPKRNQLPKRNQRVEAAYPKRNQRVEAAYPKRN